MLISIITACYNNQDTISDTILSVLNQNSGSHQVQHIIIDGASNDNTLKVLSGFKDRVHKIVSAPDKGIYDALNKGIDLAEGEIIGILHADDQYFDSQVLKHIGDLFDKGRFDVVYGDLIYVSQTSTDKIIRYWKSGSFDSAKFSKGWMPPHPTLFVRKSAFTKYGKYSLDYDIASDYELMTRFALINKLQFHYYQAIMVKMRWGGKSNRSLKNILKKMIEDYHIIRKNKVGGFYTLMSKNFSKLPQLFSKPDL